MIYIIFGLIAFLGWREYENAKERRGLMSIISGRPITGKHELKIDKGGSKP